jgi:hypothetical protein
MMVIGVREANSAAATGGPEKPSSYIFDASIALTPREKIPQIRIADPACFLRPLGIPTRGIRKELSWL